MIDLTLSVFFSSLIFVVFKLFSVHKVETFYAIIINYLTACAVGLLLFEGEFAFEEIPQKSWFPGTVFLGMLFILIFNSMARTSQRLGVSVASVATKMSLVVPVLIGVFLYKEQLGLLKVIGILLALAAVYFASIKDTPRAMKLRALSLPLMVFLGSGIIDASIKYLQEYHVDNSEFPLFSAFIFAAAALTGILIVLTRWRRSPLRVNFKNIIGGISLGIPNFFSIYFLLRALQNTTLNSASVFTLNNVAIVMFTTLAGILLFKEQISKTNWGGIIMAVLSIVLVALF